MGKRELLLISGFAVIGLLVYQLTMPATADTGGGFGAWWARVRSHVAQNWVEQHYERKDEVKVPAAVRTVAVQLDRASVTILGEARDTLAVDLSGVVYGGDEEMAKALEQQITVGVTTDGPLMKLALTLPKRDDLARRPRVQLTLRVPARLGIELRLGGGELDVTNVALAAGRQGVGPHPDRLDRRRRHRRAGPGRDRDRPRRVGGHRDPQQPGPHRRRRRLVRGRGETRRLPRPRHRRPGAPGGAGTSKPSSRISPARSASPAPAARSASATCAAPSPRRRSARRSS